MESLVTLLKKNQKITSKNTLDFAQQHGCIPVYETIDSAWNSISDKLFQALIISIKQNKGYHKLIPAVQIYQDPLVDFGKTYLQQPSVRQMTKTNQFRVLKCFKQIILNLINSELEEINSKYYAILNWCFDRIEMGLTSQWQESNDLNNIDSATPKENPTAISVPNVDQPDYQSIVKNSTHILTIIDENENSIYHSPSFKDTFGYSDKEIINKCVVNFLHSNDQKLAHEFLQTLLNNPNVLKTIRVRFLHKIKGIVYIQSSAICRIHTNNKPYIYINTVDITEQVKAEKKVKQLTTSLEKQIKTRTKELEKTIKELNIQKKNLIEQETKYRLLAENVSDVIWTTDLNGKVTYVSPSIEKQRGYKPEEILSHKLEQTLTPDSYNKVKDTLAKIYNLQQSNTTLPPYVLLELEQPCKNGSTIWTETKINFLKNTNGELIGYLGVTRDITEKKNTKEAYEQIKEERNLFFELSIDMLCIANFEGYFLQINETWTKILGWDKETLLSKPWIDFVHEDDKQDTINAGKQLTKGQNVIKFVNRYLCKDGTYRWISWNTFPVVKKGLLYAIAHDITEQKNIENKIRENEQNLKMLMDQSPLAIDIHALDGTMIQNNKAWGELWGIDNRMELIGKYNIFKDPQAKQLGLHDAFKNAQNGKATQFSELYYDPQKSNNPGEPRTLNTFVYPLMDYEGNARSIVLMHLNITERIKAEKALIKSEQQYRVLFESANDAIFIIDTQTRIIDCNDQTCHIFDLPKNKLVGKLVDNISPTLQPDGLKSKQKTKNYINDVLNEQSKIFEWTHIKSDGCEFQTEVSLNIINFWEQQYILAIVRDISERNKMKAQLEENQAILKAALESTEDGVLVIGKNRQISHYNRRFAEIWGIPEDILATNNDINLLDYADKNIIDSKNFRQKINEIYSTTKNYDDLLKFTDGRLVERKTTYLPLKNNENRVWFFRDITEKTRAEIALKNSEERFKRIVNSVYDAIFIHDMQGNVLDVNESMLKLYRVNRDEASKYTIEDYSCKDNPLKTLPTIWKQVVNGKPHFFEWKAKRPHDQHLFDVEVFLRKISFNEKDVVLANVRDITERKNNEQKMKELVETQSVLLKEVNHRVKNNLSAIISMLHKEQEKMHDKDYIKNLPMLEGLIGRIQGLATVHSLLSSMKWHPLKLDHLCEQIIKGALQGLPLTKSVYVNVTPSNVKVTSDQAHNLTLVLNELTTNTIKHAIQEKDQLEIKVDIKNSKDKLVLSYKDDGPGFPVKMLSLETEYDNIGFELIRGIITKNMRGQVKISNRKGASVKITFPYQSI